MTVLILGASGFIGSAVAAALAQAGHEVVAGARRHHEAARRAPAYRWVRAEFSELSTAESWRPLLAGVEAVVNCVGVLASGPGESPRAAHETGPAALFAACEAAGVRRVIHLSAVGVEEGAGTRYARSKLAAERALTATDLDWIVLRPSLVLGDAAYGGTALLRALAAFPFVIPLVGGGQTFRPLAMADLTGLIVRLLEDGAPSREVMEVGGPEAVGFADLARAYRGWLGLPPAPVVSVPRWAAAPLLALGDLAGLLGWPSALRSTALKQMDFNVAGDGERWRSLVGAPPLSVAEALSRRPATVADRWHARLYFVRPFAILTLAVFWIVTGLVTLGPGREAGLTLVREAGYGALAWPAWFFGGWFDVLAGLALLVRPWTRATALVMASVTVGYLIAGTAARPDLWADPLGPWLKVLPMMALCLFVAATDARR